MGAVCGLAAGRAMAEYMLEQQIDDAAMRSAAYYGQTPGAEEAIAQGYGTAPQLRADVDPVLADALGLKPGQAIDVEILAHILSGHRPDGGDWPMQQGNQHRGEKAKSAAIAYMDLTLSAPKHFSIAWALAKTEAERNSLLQAHRTAVDKTLRYIEQQAIRGALGDGYEPGRMAAITVEHYAARPTTETIRTDPATGEVYTELRSVKARRELGEDWLPTMVRL